MLKSALVVPTCFPGWTSSRGGRWSGAVWSLALLWAGVGCARAHAQDTPAAQQTHASDDVPGSNVEQARVHFERGVEFYTDGDYRAALIEFQRAYDQQRAYRLLYNLGQVSVELRDYAGAERYFRSYLADGGSEIPADRRTEVTEELAHLKTRVGSLRITTNLSGADIRVDDHSVRDPYAGPVRVSAGRRQVTAEKVGYLPVQRTVDVLGGDELNISLEFGPPITPQATAASSAPPSNALPWVTGIGSAVLLVGAGAMGFWAYQDSSAYDAQLDRYTTQADLDRLHSHMQAKALVADVLLGTAIAGAAVTAILLLTRSSGESKAQRKAQRALTFEQGQPQLSF
jgi:hypothetical protein